MAIITVSRGCSSRGKEIAERVAERLGYQCVSSEILVQASRLFGIPETKLRQSLHHAPTILDRITRGRQRYLSYIQAALLEYVKGDNVVYHGHAGHLLLPNISHVLKVRVIAELRSRIALTQQRLQISEEEALAFIESEDRHQQAWTWHLYKTETSDPRLYDMVLNLGRLKIRDVCEMICAAARSDTYRASPESKRAIENLALSSHVRAALKGVCEAKVITDDGRVSVRAWGPKLRKTGSANNHVRRGVCEQIRADLSGEVVEAVLKIPGVRELVCVVDLPYYS
jgi:cytidylate kinase